METVYRVVNTPSFNKLYRTRHGALLTQKYWRKRGHELAEVQSSPVIWSRVGGVADASSDSPGGTGTSGSNAAGPVPTAG